MRLLSVRSQWIQGLSVLLFIICLSFVLQGCSAIDSTSSKAISKDGKALSSRVTVYLQLKRPECPNIWLSIKSIELLSENQIWIPLNTKPIEIESGRIGNRQAFLARALVPNGMYNKVRFRFYKAALVKNGQKVFLGLEQTENLLPLTKSLRLFKGDSKCLFITWDVEGSFRGSALYAPDMTAYVQSIPLRDDLAYIACPYIDTIYIVRTDQNWVCGSIGISGSPSYIRANTDKNRLYVLSSKEAAIKVVQLSTNRQVDLIQIPLTSKASFMDIDPDADNAYVLDKRGNYVIKMDLNSGSLSSRVRVGDGPCYLAYIDRINQIAVSACRSQYVYLMDADSLTLQSTIQVGGTPSGLLEYDGLLYIAEGKANTVSVYDLYDGRLLKRINVGRKPRRLLSSRNHIYVANYGSRNLSIIIPGQLNVLKGFRLAGRPLEMSASTIRKWLYVGDEDKGGVWVIDLTSNRISSFIPLETKPVGIAVLH